MFPRLRAVLGMAMLFLQIVLRLSGGTDMGHSLMVPTNGHTGFLRLDSVAAGILFTNTLSPADAAQNQNLMNGSGVAAGDFDGDGRCDLYFCAIGGTNALFRNLGNWRFENVTETAGLACVGWRSTGAVFADIDGDGDLDLLVSTLGTGVHCFRNEGQGRFTEVTSDSGLGSQSGSTSMALADVDGDGDLDIYVANYGAFSVLRSGGRAEVKQVNGEWVVMGPNANRLRYVDGKIEEVGEVGVLYRNDGKGHFTAVPWNSEYFVDERGRPKAPPADYGLSVQMRDINGDGVPDIYTCNDFQTPDRLWLNDGRGHFREASHLAIRKFPFSSMGVDFADIDRDGNLDFLVVEMAPREHSRRMRQISGIRFQPNVPGRYEYRPEVNRNTLFRGNGDSTWSEIAEYAGVAATDWSWQPVFLDVDLDGYEDLLVANGMMFDTQDRDTLSRIESRGRISTAQTRAALQEYPPFRSSIAAYHNRGDLTFEDRGIAWGFSAPDVYEGVALADLDGDGDLDLAVNCLNGGVALYRNETSAPRIAVRLKGLAPNTRGVGGKLKVLGGPVSQTQEIVTGGRYLSGDDTIRTFATGTAAQVSIEVTWRSGRRASIPNAEPNRLYEIAETGNETASPGSDPAPLPIFLNQTERLGHGHTNALYDDFARQPLLPKQLSALGPGMALIDFDRDGVDEVVIGAPAGGTVGAYRWTQGRFVPLTTDWTAPDDMTGLAGWTMPDGRPALLAGVSNYKLGGTNRSRVVSLSLASGGGSLVVSPVAEVLPMSGAIGPLATADIDGDGDLDLFVGGRVLPAGYPEPVSSYLYRNQGGKLILDTASSSLLDRVGMVSGATWTDLDGDGFPELVLACEWGPIRIFRNDHGNLKPWDPEVLIGPSTNAPVRFSTLTGWWTSVSAGDMDGDGRPDLVVGNWGLNAGFRASLEQPLRLYFGDLSGRGTHAILEAYYPQGSDTEMPRRSRNALAQAIPSLMDWFPSHATFGFAKMAEVLASLPAKPQMVQATTLASTVFLNRPGGFVALPLPAEAQFAPVFGSALADFDGDGLEDLFLAQNFFAMRIEWPRTDAGNGILLKGDGHGRFSALLPSVAGVRVMGEGRGAVVGDWSGDGHLSLVVAQNGAATTLWETAKASPRFRVSLEGPPGNPAGYGSQVRVKYPDHWSATKEVTGSGGYWSKGTDTVLFGGSSSAATVQVKWPGGNTTEMAVPAGAKDVRVRWEQSVAEGKGGK
ncbi:MAG TPA: FG-GAP-like repeat-containing protein [Candidatus Limnocylindria bacterium]|nr:FG-GAP-like repeat-containing protein [Candidatus Limnocylindria bacterium]